MPEWRGGRVLICGEERKGKRYARGCRCCWVDLNAEVKKSGEGERECRGGER